MLANLEDNFQNKQLKFISILYILIPVFLISGPFLSDLSLVLIDIFFLSFVIIKKKYNFFDNFFFKLFLIFYFFYYYLQSFPATWNYH